MIKNILVSIDYEIKDSFNENYGQWDIFINNVIDILDYYKYSIYKIGKIILNKKIGNLVKNDIEYSEIDNKFLLEYDIIDFTNKLKMAIESYNNNLSKDELYNQLISIIIGKCIILFKLSQINECKNLNIQKIKLISDDIYSCDECKTYSKFIYDVNNFDINIIHPYCKISILPICNNSTNIKTSIAEFLNVPIIFTSLIKNITTKLTIQLKTFITNKKFIFNDDINFIEIKGDEIYISNNLIDKLDIENLIVRELLKDKLISIINIDWWKQQYDLKKSSKLLGDNCIIYSNPFINTESQLNYSEYFIQSYIYYILHPIILKDVDNKCYNEIKNIIKKEFIKG